MQRNSLSIRRRQASPGKQRARTLLIESLQDRCLLAGDLAMVDVCMPLDAASVSSVMAAPSVGAETFDVTPQAGRLSPSSGDNLQVVTATPDRLTAHPGDDVSFDVTYDTLPVSTPLSGFGARLHYDSSALRLDRVTNVLNANLVGLPATRDDTLDLDGDPATDKYVQVAWAGVMPNWPPSLPTRLFTPTFVVREGFAAPTVLNFTASSTAGGYQFEGNSVWIEPAAVELPELRIADAAPVTEGQEASFIVTLSSASSDEVRVDYATTAGSATQGVDYQAVSGTLVFAAGQTNANIVVPTIDDDQVEAAEHFLVRLSNATGATLADAEGRAVITDNDTSGALLDVALVAVAAPTPAGQNQLPASLTAVPVGASYHVELWVQDRSPLATGVTGGYLDVHYRTDLVNVSRLSWDFDVLAGGQVDDLSGLIDDFGGARIATGLGVAPGWVRLGAAEVLATGLGTARYSLSEGGLPFALTSQGNIDWADVSLASEAEVEQIAPAALDIRLVEMVTPSNELGETNILPANAAWVHEWQSYWIEVWVGTPDSNELGVESVTATLNYDTRYTTARQVEFNPAFDQNRSVAIDDETGQVVLSAATQRLDLGDNAYVLLARILAQPTSDDQAPVDAANHQFGPYDMAWSVADAHVSLPGVGLADPVVGTPPATELRPVVFDVNDDDRIDFGDFSLFVPAFGGAVGGPEPPWTTWADFDGSGVVDTVDVSWFASNFRKAKPDADIIWPAPPQSPSQSTSATSARDVTGPFDRSLDDELPGRDLLDGDLLDVLAANRIATGA